MKAIHVTDLRPVVKSGGTASLPDFELLCTILSALKWREHNGPIKLYADSFALKMYERERMLDLWDAGIDADSIESDAYDIDPEIFWAASKLRALCYESAPIVLLDTDMIVWQRLTCWEKKPQTSFCIHKEDLYEGVYPDAARLEIAAGYKYDPSWDWTVRPCNTAFVYHGQQDLLDNYLYEAFRFMHGKRNRPSELVSQMVFAEQRLLSMVAQQLGLELRALYSYEELFKQQAFTHLWGLKRELRQDKSRADELCRQFVVRLQSDYAKDFTSLMEIPVVQRYL